MIMDHRSAGSRGLSPAPRLWIIWANLMLALAVYAAIGYFIAPGRAAGERVLGTLVPALAVVAVFEVLAMFVIGPLLAKRAGGAAFAIVRWAVAESVAIFGLVLRFLGASVSTMAIFIAAGALLLVWWRPGRD
jgi:hypothetical protein